MKLSIDLKKHFAFIRWITKETKPFTGYLSLILGFNVIIALSGVSIAIVSKNLIDSAAKSSFKEMIFYATTFGALILINLGLGALSSLISVKSQEAFSNSVRQRLFSRISGIEWMSISKYHSGDVLTRLTSDVSAIAGGVISTFPSIITLGVQLAAAFCTLLYYEPYLAILAFVLGPFTITSSRFWGRKLKQLQIKVQESESAYRSFIQESLQNLLIVKTFRLEEQSNQKISILHKNRMKWVVKKNRSSVAASTVMGTGYWVGYLLAFLWGAFRLSSGAITFGTLTAFLQLVGQVQGPFIGLTRTLPQIIATLASVGRLIELENLPAEKITEKLPIPASAGVSYQRVSFSYYDTVPVLEKVSFNIKPGELVAVIGQSGEGKTTLIRILLALLKPSSGVVTLTGTDGIEHMISAETRDWVSYVPQGNTLFSGTIAENIWCGRLEATLDEAISAAQAACALDFIEELKDGINTVIGEKGVGLSEGQAQRIAIARALLRKAPILIFDEATSALDMDSEMHVLKSIQEMQPRRTCIVITHRPSAMKICSRVLKLEEGRLSEVSDDLEAECAVSA